MEPAEVEVEAERGVAEDLVEVAFAEVVAVDVAHGGARGGVDVEAGVLAELADAEEVGAVGDDDDVAEVVFAGDGGEAVDLLFGVDGAGLGDDVAEGDAVCQEVVAPDAALGVAGVAIAAAAEGDDDGGDLFAVEVDGVIETGVEDGGGAAGVLGGAEDGDGVGGLGIVAGGDLIDLAIDPNAPGEGDDQEKQQQLSERAGARGRTATARCRTGGDHGREMSLRQEGRER